MDAPHWQNTVALQKGFCVDGGIEKLHNLWSVLNLDFLPNWKKQTHLERFSAGFLVLPFPLCEGSAASPIRRQNDQPPVSMQIKDWTVLDRDGRKCTNTHVMWQGDGKLKSKTTDRVKYISHANEASKRISVFLLHIKSKPVIEDILCWPYLLKC